MSTVCTVVVYKIIEAMVVTSVTRKYFGETKNELFIKEPEDVNPRSAHPSASHVW